MKKELTKREKEVLKLISEGLTAKEIAKQLGISKRTIEAHTANMLQKTGAKNKAHLVAMWYEELIINSENYAFYKKRGESEACEIPIDDISNRRGIMLTDDGSKH
jgi:DNA-binding CsgD family transcriptional regulator